MEHVVDVRAEVVVTTNKTTHLFEFEGDSIEDLVYKIRRLLESD